MSHNKKPVVLVILDGWGHREETESNAIAHANTPFWDTLWQDYPRGLISGSGMDVGLPDGQMGNSEVGHMNLGAGRVVYQDFTRISKSITDNEFANNEALASAVDKAVANNKAVHLLGLLSPGGVHSHEDHIVAMIDAAVERGAKEVYLHAFLDGRDTPPRSAQGSIDKLDAAFKQQGVGRIASLVGRYYAMDRDNRWDRVEQAYKLLTQADAPYTAASASEGLQAAYARDENDEFVQTTVIANADQTPATINDGDAVIFMNFRADRAREITRAFVEDNFSGFERATRPDLAEFVMLTRYAADIPAPSAFPPMTLDNVLGDHLSKQGRTQLRVAETEKYAHVTFFFNGGIEQPFEGETRELVASPNVATYDLQPEMSAGEVTEKLTAAIKSGEYDAIICNYANGDMVGHTGDFNAAMKAAETLDGALKEVVQAVEAVEGHLLITADHGNLEQMHDADTGQAHTAHTCEHVPLVYVGNRNAKVMESGGVLSDIAPTMLSLMGETIPKEMTGKVLVS